MFNIEPLPFKIDSFTKLSAESFNIHHNKHHLTYVTNLNKLVSENQISINNLESLIQYSHLKQEDEIFKKIFNNAAQHWNHQFFWNSLTSSTTYIIDILNKLIINTYETQENFKSDFIIKGLSLFGSGWIWIVYNKITEKIEILATHNANTAVIHEHIVPLLVCDVWEHAYYVDFLNNRKEFLEVIYSYFNWDFANKNLENI